MSSIVTPTFRVSYPNVFEARKNPLSGKDEFSVEAVFEKGADLSKLKEAAQEALANQFGHDKSKWPQNLRNPFKDQALKAKDVDGQQVLPELYEEGAIYMNLRTANKPSVVDQNVQPILEKSEFYAGCYARASVSVYAYNKGGNAGVNFSLVNIQKVKDGDPLGGRTAPEEDFAPVQSAKAEASSGTDLFS